MAILSLYEKNIDNQDELKYFPPDHLYMYRSL